jgi:hypothetical protein
VYIPIGHGYENLTHPRDIVPEGCSVTVIETPGGAHKWNPDPSGELYEYERIKNYFERNPPEKNATGKIHSIFSDPKQNIKDIIDTFGSVAIFGPGEKYPNIEYSLNLYWINNSPISASDIRYSGLIPLENFLSKEYTTRNIREKLLTNKSIPVTATGAGAAYFPYVNNKEALLHNKKEQYKFSIYPSVDDIEQFWSSDEQKIQALEEKGFHDLAEKLRTHYATGNNDNEDVEEKSIELFEGVSGPPLKQEGYIYVSLKTLMEKFPGNYIHIVCRSTKETGTMFHTNPSAEQEHTQEEVFTKRIPLMSANQKRQAIAEIEQSRRNNRNSRFNAFSTKNTRNIMLAGLKRSLVQNQIKNTGNPIVLKAPVERSNETVKANGSKRNALEYTGRKWATVTTGGRTRRKLYKSKSHRNRR